MRIQVGIHENLILSKVLVSDKGRLTLFLRHLDEAVNTSEEEEDPFAQMNAAEVIEKDSNSGGIILWPFKAPDTKNRDGSERTSKEMGELANGDVMRLKNQLQQILEQYTIKDNIKWSVYDSTAMTKETYWEDIYSQNNLDVIYRNICEQFMGMIQPFLDKNEYPMRWKFARQSADKHYARIPDRYIKDQPFIEPMTVPKEQSRVKWSSYELKEKLNDPTPVSKAAADDDGEPTPEGENVFGQR